MRVRPFAEKLLVLLALLLAAGILLAAKRPEAPEAPHGRPAPERLASCPGAGLPCVINPARLGDAEAEAIYQAIRGDMQKAYALSDDPIAWSYATWRRYAVAPFRSAGHGGVFVNVYGNDLAAGLEPGAGALPEGALIAMDSFVVTAERTIRAAPLALMEKMRPGYDPAAGDWRFMTIDTDGRMSGLGRPADPVLRACAACHGAAPAGQDRLFRLPPAR
ncbi:hypothetical protein SAMN06265365_1017 [Tistlia consotensis]|uniref:Cytochrome P460 n=1 Tax=Tistlia consotensis USBA 355 TaxID=560819 RepID=A0A1Y6B8N3_9PROT|nr:hypothetical protein [Tistlia consotensis]SME87758.1 hypothetical protein SAMN05428998_1017 [Tistlia consotensis USBA 355]SNR24104.1 hypothetical protein SAMN06265365_1017 [Tistlia consotensis]